jgi:catechol 2,3-dioxygenase-like lactoylglutathione lyase family enzyme
MRGLLELVLEVADLERSVAFYRDLLEMPEVVRWGDQRPGVWVELGPHQVLGLWPPASGGPGVAIHGSRGGSHVHLACYVEPGSLPRWERRLRDAGLACEEATFAHGNRSLFVTDPDGNVVELGDWRRDWQGEPVAGPEVGQPPVTPPPGRPHPAPG